MVRCESGLEKAVESVENTFKLNFQEFIKRFGAKCVAEFGPTFTYLIKNKDNLRTNEG